MERFGPTLAPVLDPRTLCGTTRWRSMTRDLVDRAQGGDREAFEQLARLVATRLFATATLILRDADLASDVVQETLIEVWRKLPSLRDTQAFEAWLYRILVRRCYRASRSSR